MTCHTAYRKQKPQRADFRWEGKRYWISECDYWELWDGEYDRFVTFAVKDYETDEYYADDSHPNWEAFMDKVDQVGHRVLPVNPYNFDSM